MEKDKEREKRIFVQENRKCAITMSICLLEEIKPIVRSRMDNGQVILFMYNGKHYDQCSDEMIREMWHKFVMKYGIYDKFQSSFNRTLIESIKAYEKVVEVKMNEDLNLICLNNGILNIDTGELLDHTPNIPIDTMINADYNPEQTDCPIFMQFLNQVFGNNETSVKNIIKMGGYLLDSSCKANKIFLFNGPGASGKSTLIDTFLLFFDKTQISSLSLESLASNSHEREQLISSRINQAGEQKRSYIDAEQIKLISEGAAITINPKYRPAITIWPKTKIVIGCNGLPKFNDTSDGIYRRLLIFNFINQYKPKSEYESIIDPKRYRIYLKDSELFDKIKKEKTAILNLFIDGLMQLREHKYEFYFDNSVKTMMDDFKIDNDTIREFLEDYYEPSMDETTTPVQTVLNHYRMWYRATVSEGSRVNLRANELGRRIREVFKVEWEGERVEIINGQGESIVSKQYPIKRKESMNVSVQTDEGLTPIPF